MKNFHLTFLFIIIFFANINLFGQNPVANNDFEFANGSICNFGANFYNVSILQNDFAPNGKDFNSVDLDLYLPGIQNSYSDVYGNSIYYNNNGFVSGYLGNSNAQFQYTFKDNLGNTSNIGTINIDSNSNYVNWYITDTPCDNPSTGSILVYLPYVNIAFESVSFQIKAFRNNQLVGTYITAVNANQYNITGLASGTYSLEIIPTCNGGQTGSPLPNQASNFGQIRQANPLTASTVGTYVDFNNSGVIDVGDKVNFQYTVSNPNASCSYTNVNVLSDFNLNIGTIANLGVGSQDINISNSVIINQQHINNGSVAFNYKVKLNNSFSYENNFTASFPLAISNGIKLNAFIDTNNNGVQNGSEPDYTNGTFSYQINSGVVHNLNSPLAELYLYETNPANVYNLNYTINANNSFCGAQYTVATTAYPNVTVANGSGITTYNFPITTVPCNDVSVNLIQNSEPRPGFQFQNLIKYKNDGNQVASGTITFSKDASVSITGTIPFTATNSGGFVYNYTNLQPGETRFISVNMQVPNIPIVSLGQLVTNSVTITPTDANMPNNSDTGSQIIIGAYDPNDKTESHGTKILHSSFTANDYLSYTIRFENTGTAEAINIKVEDALDSKLDETSIRMVASSHPYILDRTGSNLKWSFNGVNLPPASPASTTIGHGYINFQVKPKPGFAIGDVIPNTANIYFDFNPAIVTNTYETEFVSTLYSENFTFNNFKSFPNPVKNTLTISNDSAIENIEISSIIGQKMLSKKVNNIQTEIDLSQLSNGIYFVKVTSQGNEKTINIMKE